jgi:hypothetical protein
MPRHARADVDPYPSDAHADRATAGHAHADKDVDADEDVDADGDGDPAGPHRDVRAVDAHGDRNLAACNADHDAIAHPVADRHRHPLAG